MKRICIQAGHKGITTGPTGASGERDWNTKIVDLVAERLKDKVEVYKTDALGDRDTKVTSTDWDLFLAVHYDADIYNDRGGFYDYPDKSVDQVWETSKKLSTTLGEHFFKTTKIPLRPSRSNANTKFYYMWSSLTASTPCAIIECGVGNRKPEDYNTLRDYELVSKTLSDGVLMALGLFDSTAEELAECKLKCQELEKALSDMRDSRDKWKKEAKDCQSSCAEKEAGYMQQVEGLQKTNSELTAQLSLIAKEKAKAIEERDATEDALNICENELALNNEEIIKLKAEVLKLSTQIKGMKLTSKKWWQFWVG